MLAQFQAGGKAVGAAVAMSLVSSSCGSSAPFLPLERDPAIRTVVYHFSASADLERPFLVVSGDRPDEVFHGTLLDGQGEVLRVSYSESIDVLQLSPGWLEHDPAGRPLPPGFVSVARATRDGGSVGSFAVVDPGAIGDLRVPPFDVGRCLAAGGCLGEGEHLKCLLPCPEPTPVRPVEAPAPVCPAGWLPEEGTDEEVCRPPIPATERCPAGFFRPGLSLDCRRVGAPCPAGAWPARLPEDGRPVRHVLAGAPAGGDGSPLAPYGNVQEAIDSPGADGLIVALSKGRFEQPIAVRRDHVSIVGACVEETTVLPSGGLLRVEASDVSLSNLGIQGGRLAVAASAAGVRVEGLLVTGAPGWAVVVEGTAFEGRDVLIDGCVHGILVRAGASGQLFDVVQRDRTYNGVRCEEGSHLEIFGLRIDDAPGRTDIPPAVYARSGCELEVQGLLLVNPWGALTIADPGTTAVIRDVVSLGDAAAFLETKGASTVLERAYVQTARTGLAVADAGSLEVEDLRLMQPSGGEDDRAAVFLESGGSARLERVRLENLEGAGVMQTSEAGLLVLTDATIRVESPRPREAIDIRSEARLSRVSLSGGATGLAASSRASGSYSDLRIRGARGFGLELHPTSGLAIGPVEILDSGSLAFLATTHDGTIVPTPLRDLLIRGARAGLTFEPGLPVDVERFRIEDIEGPAFFLADSVLSVNVIDGAIVATRVGVQAQKSASVRESDFARQVRFEDVGEYFQIR